LVGEDGGLRPEDATALSLAGEKDGRRAPAEAIALGARAERHATARRGLRRRPTGTGGEGSGWRGVLCLATGAGRGECRWRRRQGEGKRRWDGQQDDGLRGRLVADPPGDLRDGGRFETAGGGAILKAGVPSR
jgi:hypothetical protein